MKENIQKLVNVKEMAEILNVPESWIYERTRQGQLAIPHMRFGLYIRFYPQEVINHFKEEQN